MEIIDFRVRLRTEQLLKPWDIDNPAPHFEQYIPLYHMKPRLSVISMEEFVQNMQGQGVSKGVVCGGGIADNDHLIEVMESELGKHFYFICGINPNDGVSRCFQEVERCNQAGFLGVSFGPFMSGLNAAAKQFFPVYAYCEANNLVAIVHGSLNYDRHHSSWCGHPKYFDEVAIHFPDLKLVMSHAGNGFGNFALAVAQKHPNIYLEFSALRPKYLQKYYLEAANSYLKNRCLFGTDYPLIDFDLMIEAWSEVLKPDVKKLFFEENAKDCLFAKTV